MQSDYHGSTPSFWKATNRGRVSTKAAEQTQSSYSFNYSKFLPERKDALIIDLGCSEGIALRWLASAGYHNLWGVDSDAFAISKAGELLRSLLSAERLVAGDILNFVKGCDQGTVDLFFMLNVIEHIDKTQLLELMREIQRVLKPGGSYIAQTGNIENPLNFGLFARDFTHQIPFTPNSLRQLIVMSGFAMERVSIYPVRYQTRLRKLPFLAAAPLAGFLLKGLAYCMRVRISETEPMMYCHARKHD